MTYTVTVQTNANTFKTVDVVANTQKEAWTIIANLKIGCITNIVKKFQ